MLPDGFNLSTVGAENNVITADYQDNTYMNAE